MKTETIYRVLALCLAAYGCLPGTDGEGQSSSSVSVSETESTIMDVCEKTTEDCHSSSNGSDHTRRTLTSMCKYSFKECTIRNRHGLQANVCGSNGRTYRNVCLLERHSCLIVRGGITVEHHGPCLSGVTEKDTTKNRISGDGVGRRDEIHRRQCRRVIKRGCRRSMRAGPVCATNHRTYPNECIFWKETCKVHQYISIAHKGTCHVSTDAQEPSPVTTVMPQTEGPAECLSTCKPGFSFVCGTDSATYLSECHLKKLACRSNIDVAVQYRGVCRPRLGPNVIPGKGVSTPVTTNRPGDGSGDCGRCSDLGYRPVCGTDSMTYYSACILYEYSCKLNDATLRIKHQGRCQTDTAWDCQTRCRRLGGEEVCGTDGRTYASECHLRRRTCNRENLNLTIAYRGNCIKPSISDACQRRCFHRYEPVCGSDGVTYLNPCFLEAARCRNSAIELEQEGICQSIAS